MELAFSVAWGPISQVAVPLLDVKTAVQLAVGAYGWWKARERSITLVDMVHAIGGQLAPCTTFNAAQYQFVRRKTEVRGIAWYNGRLEAVPLPRASTGNWGDLGLICLRALTTALLTLYNIDATAAVLSRIIPKRLINYDVEDTTFVDDGPFRACVRQFVDSVAAEEETNTLRTDLWRRLDTTMDEMLSDSTRRFKFNADDVREVEVPIVIGLVDWALTSPNKRLSPSYLTRSLTAWSLAVLLSYLGFEVRAFTKAIDSRELYDQAISTNTALPHSSVCLVTYNAGKTDLLAPIPGFDTCIKHLSTHRIVPIKAIPVVIFRHVCYRYKCSTTELTRLCEIWDRSFENASALFGPVQVTEFGDIRLPIILEDNELQTSSQSADGLDHQALFHLMGRQLKEFMPHIEWEVSTFEIQCEKYATCKDHEEWRKVEDFYSFAAIVLATTYAAFCPSLCIEDLEPSSKALIEVAVDENMLSGPSKRVPFWSQLLEATSESEERNISQGQWMELVFNMLTGFWDQDSMTNIPYDAFGYYKNGIFLITDFMLRPSIYPESLVRFHIQHGQPLQFPVNENGFIISSNGDLSLNSEPLAITNLPAIEALQSQKSDLKLRIDLEPYWEGDSRKVTFRAPTQGISLIVHAGGDMASQVLCIICFEPPVFIASDCIKCAHATIDRLRRTEEEELVLLGASAKGAGHVLVDGPGTVM